MHQLINNQRNICSGLKMVGRRTGFCDKSILWGGFFLFFFFSSQGLCKKAVLIHDLSKQQGVKKSARTAFQGI